MNSGRKFVFQKLNCSLVIWVCFVFLSINALAFIYFVAAPHIQADVWRHLKNIVLPLLDGRESLSVLWSNHHPSPLLHLIQITNLKFFGFRLDYDAYLGFFLQVLTTLIIIKSVLSTTAVENRKIGFIATLSAILILFIAFGFNTLLQYTFPLLTTVQYLYFLGIVVFVLVDKSIHEESRMRHLIVALAALTFMFANADYGTIFIAAIIGVLVLAYFVDRQAVYLRTVLVLASVWVAYRLFLLTMVPESTPVDTWELVKALARNPLRTSSQFSIALSSGLFDIVSLKNHFPGATSFLVGLSMSVALLFVATFITYLRRKLFQVTMIPLALMLLGVIFSIPTLIYRFYLLADDIWGLAAGRYVPTFKLAIIGMLWALLLIVRERESIRGEALTWPYKIAGVIALGIMLFVQGAQIYSGWKRAPHLQWSAENHALAVYLAGKTSENDIQLPRSNIRLQKNYHQVLAYLEENRLNVFSEKFPRSNLLDQHVASRRSFRASETATLLIDRNQNNARILQQTGDIEADWKIDPRSIIIEKNDGKSLFIRVEVSSTFVGKSSNSLSVTIGKKPPKKINLYKGKQNLFFSLEKDTRLSIKVPPQNKIEEVELRR